MVRFLKVLLLIRCKVSLRLLLAFPAASFQGCPDPHPCSGFPVPLPLTLYLQSASSLESICVCKQLWNLGPAEHTALTCPEAPARSGEGSPLLWPTEPQVHSVCYRVCHFFPSIISDTGLWGSPKLRATAKSQMLRKILQF